MALYGYARVSTLDQNLGIQRAALKAAGCDVIRAEKVRGTRRDGRTELQVLLDFLRPGDALVITRIDRLARSLKDLQDIIHELKERRVALRATEQPINTGTAAGKAFLDMLGVFAEFETNLRKERRHDEVILMQALDLLGAQRDLRIAPTEGDVGMMSLCLGEFSRTVDKCKGLTAAPNGEANITAAPNPSSNSCPDRRKPTRTPPPGNFSMIRRWGIGKNVRSGQGRGVSICYSRGGRQCSACRSPRSMTTRRLDPDLIGPETPWQGLTTRLPGGRRLWFAPMAVWQV
jgi:hypothetical protein